ncbi:carbohydrate kinase [Clostridiales bacterium COT073_COT-073]|nr:carbohydrate kinase [Clostridiales bacterium COT073_COT-073]
MKKCILMNLHDEVATVLEDVHIGDTVGVFNTESQLVMEQIAKENIPFGNKIALKDKNIGEKIIKYGSIIGEVTAVIEVGKLVHVHNVKSLAVDIPPAFKREIIRQMNIKMVVSSDL